ncbi:MAG: UvrD-helicase domain-containing protein [Bacillota bacterium]
MELLEQLNSEQREAVCQTEGPVLVLAGAGSGKTRVLTYRIAYLVEERRVNPFNILAITFTNKAAQEMKSRLVNMLSFFKSPWVCTFHAACTRILRREIEVLGYSRDFTIYDDSDQQTLIKEGLRTFNLDEKKYPPRSIAYQIGEAKNRLLGPEGFARRASTLNDKKIAELYIWYQKRLKELNGLDFDDLIMQTVQLFRDNPEILDYYQNKFQYILVDEYQDTNHSQYVLVKMLADKHRNLCVVGDPDQSIYGWRGADLTNILNFEKDYPEARIIKLEENYRSTQTILEAANQVVKQNRSRKEKKLWTSNGPGQPIIEYQGFTEQDEARFVAERILFLKQQEKRRYRDFAVFYRVHAQSRVLEEALLRFQIPFRIIGGQGFYQRKEIRDLLAYLRVIANPADNVSLSRIINVPRRGIGDVTWKRIVELAAEREISYYEAVCLMGSQLKEQGKPAHPVVIFAELMESFRRLGDQAELTPLVQQVLERSGYLRELQAENTVEARSRIENLQEFLSVTKDYDEHPEEFDEEEDLGPDKEEITLETDPPINALVNNSINNSNSHNSTNRLANNSITNNLLDNASNINNSGNQKAGLSRLGQFLARIALVTSLDTYSEEEDTVVLMTLHGAKGLEFPVVFLTGMEEDVFPHSRAKFDQDELEEERRLCYVGITRAKEKLYLTHALARTIFGFQRNNPPSRFLTEIPPHLISNQDPSLANRRSSGSVKSKTDSATEEGLSYYSVPAAGNQVESGRQGKKKTLTDVRRKSGDTTQKTGADKGKAKEIQSLTVGDKVVHTKWGPGVVVQVKGEGPDSQVAVAFPEQGIKQLMLAYAPLTKVAE